jgi:acetyl esterase
VAPAIVLLPEFDPLHDEGLSYAERLAAADVPVTVSRWKGMTHGFVSFPAVFDPADEAVRWVGSVICNALGLPAAVLASATD